jgi:hypothetical protein
MRLYPDEDMSSDPGHGVQQLVGGHAIELAVVELRQAGLRNADEAAERALAQVALLLGLVEDADKVRLVGEARRGRRVEADVRKALPLLSSYSMGSG